MNKNFEKELIALINKYGMEKEFGDTQDFILAKMAIVSMMNFSAATQERDKWHGFKGADEPRQKNRSIPEDCRICIDRFRYSESMRRHLANIELLRLNETEGEIPSYVKEVAEELGKALGAEVEVYRFESPVKKRRFKKKPKKAPQGEKPTIEENDADLDKIVIDALKELNKRGKVMRLVFKDKKDGREHTYLPKEENENEQK